MCERRDHLLVLLATLVFLFIAFVCEAQTIRSQRKLGLLDGMTGVVTSIGGTRVTISFQETDDTLTVHVRDASDLKVGDTVKIAGGRPVKVEASAEPPKQVDTEKAKDSPPVIPAAQPQPGPSEPPKPGPNAQK